MSRGLSTCCLALSNVIKRGVKVWAVPHIQNFDSGPNGTGKDLIEMRNFYGVSDGEKTVEGTGEFAGMVDVTTFMTEDWNKKEDGRWSPPEIGWRIQFVRDLLKKILDEANGKHIEVFIVGHGSTLENLVGDRELSPLRLNDP